MLRVLTAGESRPYRIPWRIDRAHETHPLVTNGGDEPADFVRVFRADGDTEHWGRLLPGETAELCLCETDIDTAIVTLCWFRPGTEIEYAWRFVM